MLLAVRLLSIPLAVMEAFCLETKMKDVAMPCHARLQLGVDSLILSERSVARTVRTAVNSG